MLITVIRFQIAAIKNNLLTFLFVIATALIVTYIGYRHNTIAQSIVYLFVMYLCSFIIDLYAIRKKANKNFIVRNPQRETIYFLGCVFLGLTFFYFRFFGDWEHLKPIVRIAVIPLVIFVFPIALAIIMLLLKYKPKDLGFRLQGFIVTFPIIAMSVLANRIISPESLTWKAVITESGSSLGALFTGLIVAGLSEEFFRAIGQTRIGALLKNNGIGWFVATLIWALIHAPKWYAEQNDITEALLSSVRIIPIGLMLGYLTHRTKSFLPAVIVHGTNFWGLQNF